VVGVLALRASAGPSAVTPEAMGYLFAAVVLPAIVTGFWASRSSSAWPLWRTIVTYIAMLVVVGVLQAAGKLRT
jgi:hypothetical protein